MAQQWYCRISGKQYGPLSSQQLKQLAATGKLKPEDGVRRESDDKWAAAGKVKGLFADGTPATKTSTKPKPKPRTASPSAARPGEKSAPKSGQKPKAKRVPVAKPIAPRDPEPPADDDDDEIMLAPVEPAAKQPEFAGTIAAAHTSTGLPSSPASAGQRDLPPERSALAEDSLNYVRVLATAGTGVAIGFGTICLAQIPILPLMAGALGVLFAIRAFALSKADRNAIGLSLVAVVLSLVGFFWGLRSTLADPQPTVTLQEAFGIIQPNPDQGTLQAKRDIGELGSLAVTVHESYVGTVPAVPESHYYVVIGLRLKNESTGESINYQSWSVAENGAILSDISGGKIYGIVTDDRIKGQLSSMSLPPNSVQKDVLVFENPSGFHDELRLTLSGRAVGHPGKLVFAIPHTVDDFRRSPLGASEKKKPAK